MPDHDQPTCYLKTNRTRVRHHPEQATYDQALVHDILDQSLHCHIAWVEAGEPRQLPAACWRDGNVLYIHSGRGNNMLQALVDGRTSCVSVSHIDGLVLSRAAMDTSMNYRSVVIYGQFFEVIEPQEKYQQLKRFFRHVLPGRWEEVRPPSEKELAVTTILGIPLNESVAKQRSGPPCDSEADRALPVWAGVLSRETRWSQIETDPHCGDLAIAPSATHAFHQRQWTQK